MKLEIINTTGYYFPVVTQLCESWASSEECGFMANTILVTLINDLFLVQVIEKGTNYGATVYTVAKEAYHKYYDNWAFLETGAWYKLWHFDCESYAGGGKDFQPESMAICNAQFNAELNTTVHGEQAKAWALYYCEGTEPNKSKKGIFYTRFNYGMLEYA